MRLYVYLAAMALSFLAVGCENSSHKANILDRKNSGSPAASQVKLSTIRKMYKTLKLECISTTKTDSDDAKTTEPEVVWDVKKNYGNQKVVTYKNQHHGVESATQLKMQLAKGVKDEEDGQTPVQLIVKETSHTVSLLKSEESDEEVPFDLKANGEWTRADEFLIPENTPAVILYRTYKLPSNQEISEQVDCQLQAELQDREENLELREAPEFDSDRSE